MLKFLNDCAHILKAPQGNRLALFTGLMRNQKRLGFNVFHPDPGEFRFFTERYSLARIIAFVPKLILSSSLTAGPTSACQRCTSNGFPQKAELDALSRIHIRI